MLTFSCNYRQKNPMLNTFWNKNRRWFVAKWIERRENDSERCGFCIRSPWLSYQIRKTGIKKILGNIEVGEAICARK